MAVKPRPCSASWRMPGPIVDVSAGEGPPLSPPTPPQPPPHRFWVPSNLLDLVAFLVQCTGSAPACFLASTIGAERARVGDSYEETTLWLCSSRARRGHD